MPPLQIFILQDERLIAAELKRRLSRLGYTVVAADFRRLRTDGAGE
jgi:hypothetical protein